MNEEDEFSAEELEVISGGVGGPCTYTDQCPQYFLCKAGKCLPRFSPPERLRRV